MEEQPIKKNRLRLEPSEYSERIDLPEETDFSDSSEYRVQKKYGKIWLWSFFLVLLLGALGFGVYYKFYRVQSPENQNVANSQAPILEGPSEMSRLLEEPYLPATNANPELARCIQLYRDNFIRQATLRCQEFLESPASPEEKSVALTVLGVIYLDAQRFTQSIEQLEKAKDFDEMNFHAYYNLALAYKKSGQIADAKLMAKKAKEIAPRDPRIALLAGNLFQELNETGEAIDAYKEGISSNPNDPSLSYNLALSYYRQGQIPEAIETFQKVILLSGNGKLASKSHAFLGSIFFSREDLNQAEYHYREAARLEPDEAKYLYNLGLVLQKQNKSEEALREYRRAISAGTNDIEVYRYLADSLAAMGMNDLAVQALQKGLSYKPADVESLFMLAERYYDKGDLIGAEETYRKVVSITPGDSYTETALLNLGILMDKMERYSDAQETLQKAIKLNPNNDKVYFVLGNVYEHLGEGPKALDAWRKAVRINPDSVENREVIGDYLYEKGFYSEAVDSYSALLRQKPKEYGAYLKIAAAYSQLGDLDAAEKSYLRVLNESRDASQLKQAHSGLARIYSKSSDPNLKSRAKDEAFRSVHMDTQDMESRLLLSKVLIDSDSLLDRERAIDELQVIVQSETTPSILAKAYNYLGICYYKNGEYERAVREFQNALDMDPGLTDAYRNKRAALAAMEKQTQKNRFF